ncbi:amidohydrolase [Sporolactobacillus sp. THM7-4]|nr:amidohydrolase [Sporolactobacillus sp. THM7-4]
MTNHNVDHLENELISVRRHLHQHPELAYEEVQTTAFLKEKLLAAGIRILDVPLKTGLIAEVSGNPDGPIVAIRADIDALPVQEETGLSYQSKVPGKMHACGHDFHTAVILGAAYLLKKEEQQLPGTVRILFQPAEESSHGAETVLASGGLDDVQAIFGEHNTPQLEVGELGTRVGALTAAVDRFEIELEGKGTHAAAPENGRDPIVAASHLINLLQTIVSRNTSPLDAALVSVTQLTSGNTWNVIPTKAYLQGTVRTLSDETRAFIPERMKRITESVGEGLGIQVTFKWLPGPPATKNDPQWTALAERVAKETGYRFIEIPPTLGGEDFAYYQTKIPGAFVNIGTGSSYNHHHPKFTIDEKAIVPASRYFSKLAVRALEHLSSNQ